VPGKRMGAEYMKEAFKAESKGDRHPLVWPLMAFVFFGWMP